jgi:hypothetical protein
MKPGDAAALARYVQKQAPQYRLDPYAVLAVALQEGIGGGIGDHGTSFGPWQLHQGGAYPAAAPQGGQAANAWAWSPAGVNYALSRMGSVAGGLKGKQAVHAIVYQFERPADPASEYAAAVKALPSSEGGSGGGGGILGDLGKVGLNPVAAVHEVGGVVGAAGSAVSATEQVGSFLGKLTDPRIWIRALEIVGGGVILMLGLYLLARSIGLAPSGSQAAQAALKVTPAGRALSVESKAAGLARG